MMRAVRFLPEALEDLITTQRWYSSREPGLEKDFAEFPCFYGPVRRLVVRRFPYALYFREVGDEILVLAVHGRQNPRRWQART
jgi:plasmid stabilization system protein ParE